VGKGMDKNAIQRTRIGLEIGQWSGFADGMASKRAGLEWRVFGSGKMSRVQLGARCWPQQPCKNGVTAVAAVVQNAGIVVSGGPGSKVRAGMGRADGTKKAGETRKPRIESPESAVATEATSWLWSRELDSVMVRGAARP